MPVRARAQRGIVKSQALRSRPRSSIGVTAESLEPRRLLSYNLAISDRGSTSVHAVGGSFVADGPNERVNFYDIQTALTNGDVTVSTGTGGSQSGSIVWDDNVDFNYAGAAARTLSLISSPDLAGGGISINRNIYSSQAPLNLNLSSSGPVNLGANFTTLGGNISVTANSVTVATSSQIDAGKGTVALAPFSPGRGVSLGYSDPNTLSITDTELSQITAGQIQIGSANSGMFGIGGPITAHGGYNTLSLQSGSIIVGGGPITVGNLSMVASANISLFSNNFVTNYAAQVTSPGASITLHNGKNMTIGTVGSLTGITTAGGGVNLTAIGSINVTSNINAGSGAVAFSPSAGVMEAAAVAIVGGSIVQLSGSVLSNYSGSVHSTGRGGMNFSGTLFVTGGANYLFTGKLIVDTGELVFAQPGLATVAGVISGSGGISIGANGTVILSNNNTYTGSTEVTGGELTIDGSIASLAGVTVNGTLTCGGTFAGPIFVTGTLAGKGLTVNGSVEVDTRGSISGDLTVNGPTTIYAGGTMAARINAAELIMNPGSLFNGAVTAAGDVYLNNPIFINPYILDSMGYFVHATGGIFGQFAYNYYTPYIVYMQHSLQYRFGADIGLSETGDSTVAPGTDVTFTIAITDFGSQDAPNVVINDTPPSGLSIASYIVTQNGYPYSMSATNNNTTFALPPMSGGLQNALGQTFLVPETTDTITVTMHVPLNIAPGTILTNSASVTSDVSDLNPDNNTATFSTVVPGSDVSVAAAGPAGGGVENQPVTYTVTVNNAGPSDAGAVQLSAAIPSNGTFVSAMQTSGPAFSLSTPAAGGGGTISGSASNLASGSSATFLVTLLATDEGTLSLSPTINSTTADPNLANNLAVATELIADAPIAATGASLPAVSNTSFTRKTASFTDADPQPDMTEYTASISWGDGSVTSGLVQPNGSGGFDVIGTHTYTTAGSRGIVTTIHDVGVGAIVQSTATVTDPPAPITEPTLIPSSATVKSATINRVLSGVILSFTIGKSPRVLTRPFSGIINWGDGRTTWATFKLNPRTGHWDVIGDHTYKKRGQYKIHVTLMRTAATVTLATTVVVR